MSTIDESPDESAGESTAESTVYERLGGHVAVRRLADAWHRRCLADPVVAHAFSHPGQHPDHDERLAAYWSETLGGPPLYTGGEGREPLGDESHVLRMHSGNGDHEEMDRRAVACFVAASLCLVALCVHAFFAVF